MSLLDSGIDVAKNELNNIYGEANDEKIFNLAKSVKLHIIDFALNYDKNKSTDENIAHYAGNFIEAVFIGTAAASVLGTTISGGWLIASAGAVGIIVTEGLKALGFELGDYTEIAYKIAKRKNCIYG